MSKELPTTTIAIKTVAGSDESTEDNKLSESSSLSLVNNTVKGDDEPPEQHLELVLP